MTLASLVLALSMTLVGMDVAAQQAEPAPYYRSMAKRLIQASRDFEILAHGECAPYTNKVATSDDDFRLMAATALVPDRDQLRHELVAILREVLADEARRMKVARELASLAGAPGTTAEFKCGFVLGAASIALGQSRAEWARAHLLPEPGVPLP